MTLQSMTGFARLEGGHLATAWTLEARSVNGRSLETRLRLPPGFEGLEADFRAAAARYLKRGNVQVVLTLRETGAGAALKLNRQALETAIAAAREISSRPGFAMPQLDPVALLSIRGVLEPEEALVGEEETKARAALLIKDGDKLFALLAASRAREGAAIAAMLEGFIERIAALTGTAAGIAAELAPKIRERIKEQVGLLLASGAPASEERLAQELAFIAVKSDIREEIDRLKAHVAAAQDLIRSGEAVGRKLDFLTQEFNREANTLCSKSGDIALTRVGLELKSVIDQLKEQVQNVE